MGGPQPTLLGRGCPLQTGASTQGPWPPWRPASWTRDEQPSLWSLPTWLLSKRVPQVWGGWRAEWPWAEGCAPHPQPLPAGLLSPLQVVTAETLMDLSDFSENDQAPAAGEVRPSRYVLGPAVLQEGQSTLPVAPWPGFPAGGCGLEQHCPPRYPNLFTNLESTQIKSNCPG